MTEFEAERQRIRDDMAKLQAELDAAEAAERKRIEAERVERERKWEEDQRRWEETKGTLDALEQRPDWPAIKAELRAKLEGR